MKLIQKSIASLIASFSLVLITPASAQLGNGGLNLMIGGGYLAEPSTPYFFAQVGWTAYEDARFAHRIFGEGLFHADDSQLDFIGPGNVILFSEDADIIFANLTANYELVVKIAKPLSLYAGGGAGVEAITINDRFEQALDEDLNFVAQVFAGIRVRLGSTIDASVGVRRIFREDFSLLNDQFITEDAWGFEAGVGFRF